MDIKYINKFYANFLKNSQVIKIIIKNIFEFYLVSLKNDNSVLWIPYFYVFGLKNLQIPQKLSIKKPKKNQPFPEIPSDFKAE